METYMDDVIECVMLKKDSNVEEMGKLDKLINPSETISNDVTITNNHTQLDHLPDDKNIINNYNMAHCAQPENVIINFDLFSNNCADHSFSNYNNNNNNDDNDNDANSIIKSSVKSDDANIYIEKIKSNSSLNELEEPLCNDFIINQTAYIALKTEYFENSIYACPLDYEYLYITDNTNKYNIRKDFTNPISFGKPKFQEMNIKVKTRKPVPTPRRKRLPRASNISNSSEILNQDNSYITNPKFSGSIKKSQSELIYSQIRSEEIVEKGTLKKMCYTDDSSIYSLRRNCESFSGFTFCDSLEMYKTNTISSDDLTFSDQEKKYFDKQNEEKITKHVSSKPFITKKDYSFFKNLKTFLKPSKKEKEDRLKTIFYL